MGNNNKKTKTQNMVDIQTINQFQRKSLYSARVENKTKRPITIEATYAPSTMVADVEEKMTKPIKPGDSTTFGPKMVNDSKMQILKFFVTDGNKDSKSIHGPFVEMDRDREYFVIEESDQDSLHFHKGHEE